MISESEARRSILDSIRPLPPRVISLAQALNCFAAKDYLARFPLPNFDNSAMDGYAVVAASSTAGSRLRVIGEQPAGRDRHLRLSAGEAIRIFTGAPIPAGADAVVMQEDVTAEGSEIVINTGVERGEFVRRKGCDLSAGQKVLSGGDRIAAVHAALLASQGYAEVQVGGTVSAAVISTGDELVEPGRELESGQIYDSNGRLLDALLQNCGVSDRTVEHSSDDRDVLTKTIERGLKNSLLIISGGVSVGEHDLVREALVALGARIELWRVAIKPGKPFLFGRAGSCAVFGLPGNPVSSFVTFLAFVRPAILKMMGAAERELQLRMVNANLTEDIAGDAQRPHYIRGRLDNGEFTPMGRQESHALFGLSRSNAILRVPSGGYLKKGATVEVRIWD